MARRSEHSKEEIKQMVLAAAENIVVDEGFSALKVRKIALDIGYTVGSIYMVFENMADLIMHVKAKTLTDLGGQLTAVNTDSPAKQCVVALAKSYLLFAHQNFNRWSMIFEHRIPADQIIPQWYQDKVNQVFKPVEIQFARLAPQCSEQQCKKAARALWSGVHGICTLSLTGKADVAGIQDVEETIVLLVESFIDGWSDSLELNER